MLWRKRFAAAFTVSETFPLGTIVGASGGILRFKVSASTSNSEVNGQSIARVG